VCSATNTTTDPPPRAAPPRPPPPRQLALAPHKPLPRTNPYYTSPKSPLAEFGPFRQADAPPPHLPDVVHRAAAPGPRHHLSSLCLAPRPATLARSLSHQSLFSPELATANGCNPFLPSRPLPSNPFLWPISCLPPPDPAHPARRLGAALFAELLLPPRPEPPTAPPGRSERPPSATNTNIADPLTSHPARHPGLGQQAPKELPKLQQDKYSALAELDDLFKSTAIQCE
jgi:hypothetical protein